MAELIVGRRLRELPFPSTPIGAEVYGEKFGESVRLKVGEAGGLNTLGDDGRVPLGQIPTEIVYFTQDGDGATQRTTAEKLSDVVSVRDFGAKGNGTDDDGASIIGAFDTGKQIHFPAGNYKNSAGAISLPFNGVAVFESGADIANSGAGTFSSSGTVIHFGHNPDNATWTDYTDKKHRVGLFVDLNGHGSIGFDNLAGHVGVLGAVNIPTGAMTGGWGVAGYAKTVAPGGPAVAIYGEGNCKADNTVVWGINTRSQDLGFDAAQVWGAEIDVNVTNAGSTAVGCDVVGGSTVMPAISIAYRVGPLGTFANPKIPWARGFFVDDAAALIGLELGTGLLTPNVGCPPIKFMYRDSINSRRSGGAIAVDGGGALVIDQDDGSFIKLRGRSAGTGYDVVQVTGNQLGFFGSAPTAKGAITGSRGGNAALASLLTALANKGLITDSTSA